MPYTAIISQDVTFCLGLFDTEEDAQEKFLEYLRKNAGFKEWFEKVEKRYHEEREETLNFEESIFDMDEYVEFWEAEISFAIIELETGQLFEFYDWTDWIDAYEMRNLYTLLKAALEDTRFCVDIDFFAEYYPLV